MKKPATRLSAPPGITPTGIEFDLSLENGRTTFTDPIQVAVSYNHKQMSEAAQSRLRVYYRRDDGLIRLVRGFVDLLTKEFKFSTDHFSSFFLAESASFYPDPVTIGIPGQPLTIQVSIINDVPVILATLFYRVAETGIWKSLIMTKVGDFLEATIPGSDVTSEGLSYYIEGSDGVEIVTSRVIGVYFGPDTHEVDDSFDQAGVIVLNDEYPQQHNFHDEGDQDWVMFYGIAGETYEIKTENLGLKSDTVITLYDQDGTTVIQAQDDYAYGEGELLSWQCPADGIYYPESVS